MHTPVLRSRAEPPESSEMVVNPCRSAMVLILENIRRKMRRQQAAGLTGGGVQCGCSASFRYDTASLADDALACVAERFTAKS
mmetsp:Transcript_13655/g.22337  ORF Transcript_13655/g.22337 Transcript_13655/m.22337 type:complete len:83 (+) Transcript_13655:1122-1370(+)